MRRERVRHWVEGLNCRVGMLPAVVLGELNAGWVWIFVAPKNEIPVTVNSSDRNPGKCPSFRDET